MKRLVDWNAHLMPRMREYIAEPAESVRVLLEMRSRFGIDTFCMTADFDAAIETVPMFLLRFSRSEKLLRPYLKKELKGFQIRCFASVLLLPDIYLTPDLDKLLFTREELLPIRLPICDYEDWMDLEFNHLLYKAKFGLFFTSFETAVLLYPPQVVERLTRISRAVFQFNYRSLADARVCAVIKSLIAQRRHVLLGTAISSMDKLYFFEMDHYLNNARVRFSAEEHRILMNQIKWFGML